MSALVLGVVLERFPARDAQQLAVALVLADAADHDGTHIFPSVGRVAKLARTSERTVQRTLADFRESGFLTLIAPGGGRCRPSEYAINMVWLGAQMSVLVSLKTKGDAQSPFSETVTADDDEADKPRQKGDKRVTKPCHSYGTQPTYPSTRLPNTTSGASAGVENGGGGVDEDHPLGGELPTLDEIIDAAVWKLQVDGRLKTEVGFRATKRRALKDSTPTREDLQIHAAWRDAKAQQAKLTEQRAERDRALLLLQTSPPPDTSLLGKKIAAASKRRAMREADMYE